MPITRTPNEKLRDKAIMHAILLERLKKHEVRQITALLKKEIVPSLMGSLSGRIARIKSRGFDTGPWTTQQYRNAITRSSEIISAGVAVARKHSVESLLKIGKMEMDWQVKALKDSMTFSWDFSTPGVNQLRQVISNNPIEGQFLKGWWDGVAKSTQKNVSSALNRGFIRGDSTQAITRSVKQALSSTTRHAEAVTRTAITSTAAGARELVYEDNKDIVRAILWISTLDHRTSPACQALDGQEFPVGEGPRPPAHVRCRSMTAPQTHKGSDILGIRPGNRKRKDRSGQRAAITGKTASKETYGTWLKKQPASDQDSILGPGKAKLFRSGKVSIEKFVDSDYRALSLEKILENLKA